MNNTPAFPMQPTMVGGEYCEGYDGMTLRDYFASQAMQALRPEWKDTLFSDFASECYKLADEMLLAREAK